MNQQARRRLSPHSIAFTLLLGALVTMASFATDMGLPVLPEMATTFGVPPGTAALSLSVFIAGFALGPLLFGPISDHIGRRPVLLTGCAMFATFGTLGAFSASFRSLLLWRLLMGMGAGGSQVLVVAMVRDLFTGVEARVKQSYVNLAAGVAPVIAPTVGVAVATLGGWHAIYGALALGGVALFVGAALGLDESLQIRERSTLSARGVVAGYVRVLTNRISAGYALVVALNFGALFAYVAGSSLVLIGAFGVSRRVYGLLFAATSFGLMVGAFTNARLSRRGVSHARLITWGMTTILGTAAILLTVTVLGQMRVAVLVPVAVVGFIGHGVVRPNAVQGALEPMPDIAGAASAVLSALQMLVGSAASALVAELFDGRSSLSMTSIMALSAAASTVVYATVVRPAERTRAGAHRVVGTAAPTAD